MLTSRFSLFILLLISEISCGVRGDPAPPNYPATLGRSRPSYQKPQNQISVPALPSPQEVENESKKEKKKN